jgi:phosphoribosyl-AMP cyclohydrolase
MAAGVFAFADPKEPLEEVRIGHDFEPEPGGPTRRSTAHGLGPRGRATTGSSDVVDARSCEYGSMNALEEGTVAQIDFEKVRSAARSTHALIPVVLQDGDSHEVLFVGYANDLALDEALHSKRAVLWSASRDELWTKGATSGDVLDLLDVRVNCEQNALLYLVRPRTGGACHTVTSEGTSRRTCFYRRALDASTLEFIAGFGPTP